MHRICALAAALGGLTIGMSVTADIIYSGPLDLEVVNDGGTSIGDPATVTIGSHSWSFGFVVGGPLDYGFINALTNDTGLFSTGTIEFSTTARNFAAGDTIGGSTTGLEMYPIGPGSSENENLTLHDYVDGSGDFSANGTGFIGFAFGGLLDRNYGWMEFSLTEADDRRVISLLGWAYNDESGGSITAGQTGVVPGAGALAGLLGVAGLRARRRRG